MFDDTARWTSMPKSSSRMLPRVPLAITDLERSAEQLAATIAPDRGLFMNCAAGRIERLIWPG